MIFEKESISCIDKILNKSNDEGFFDTETGKIWLGHAIREIMEHLKERDKELIELKNCLILLLTVSNSRNTIPDISTSRGKNFRELNIQEKKDVLEILHSEYLQY